MDKPKSLSRGDLEQLGFEDVTTLTQKLGNALIEACRLAERGAVGAIREGTKLALVAVIVSTVLTQGCIERKKFNWLWGDLAAHADAYNDVHSSGGDAILDGGGDGGDPPDFVIGPDVVIGPDDSQGEEVIDQKGVDATWQDLQELVDAGFVDIPDIQQDLKDALEDLPLETTAPDVQPDIQSDVPPPNCNDNNPCTTDELSEEGCVNTPINCDDGIDCTDDACKEGACFHFPNDEICEDDNTCTDDMCLEEEGCVSTYNSDPCLLLDDLCALESMCEEGLCVPVTWTDCDDGNECVNNFCAPATGECEDANNEDPCDDADPCTTDDQCGEGMCAGIPTVCDDAGTVCLDALCVPTADCNQTQGYTFHIVGSGVNVVRLFKNGEIFNASSNTTMNTTFDCDCGDTCVISVKKAGVSFFKVTIESNGSATPVEMGMSNKCVIDEFADGEVYTFTDIFEFIDQIMSYVISHETDVGDFNECWTFVGPVSN